MPDSDSAAVAGQAGKDVVHRRLARDIDAVWHVPSATLPTEGDDFFTEDGFHLAAPGYRAWAEVIALPLAEAAKTARP